MPKRFRSNNSTFDNTQVHRIITTSGEPVTLGYLSELLGAMGLQIVEGRATPRRESRGEVLLPDTVLQAMKKIEDKNRRVSLADLRWEMAGTPEAFNALLKRMQVSGLITLMPPTSGEVSDYLLNQGIPTSSGEMLVYAYRV